jgi:hypothetical protein
MYSSLCKLSQKTYRRKAGMVQVEKVGVPLVRIERTTNSLEGWCSVH